MALLHNTFGIAARNFTAHPEMPDARALVEYGVKMEQMGFDSLWVWDHILLGVEPSFPIIDSLTLLTAIAARTKKIKLATGILVLPLRNPVVLAKQLSSMDQLSEGRLLMAMAAGWYRREFDAVGVPFEQRGKIMDENLDILYRFWTEDMVKGEFTYHKIPAGVMYPKPAQRPRPPILIGGYVDRVLKRAAVSGDGWLTYFYRPESFVGKDPRLRPRGRQGPGQAAQRLPAAHHDRQVACRHRERHDGVARPRMGLCGLERVHQGQRHHGHGRRMRGAAQGASRRRRAKTHLRAVQVSA
jgi:probable F420-dependent oxidoreductase